MSAFDWIEMLMKGAVIVFLIFCLPWAALFRKWVKPYPYQLEPFEYFAYGGLVPKRWLVLEYYAGRPADAPAGKGYFNYSDGGREYVSVARVRRP